ncbi:hypothetical protein [uncultured Muribaculum sp.]|uniref:hypothetical protein n=1 Tax=uncultured Muribaculum sp. TaxID=1918613 RepID=UPI0025CED9F1|nr:hypothetical protein [uncultured Muribaculum sp.]
MTRIAHILSWVLSPILIPTYAVFAALWLTPLAMLPAGARWNVVMMTCFVTCVLPGMAIMLLYWMKIISDPGLNNRTERLVPYVLTIVCYLACAWYLFSIHVPHWMWMFMVAGACTAVISCIVNIWWKISAHAAAMAGFTAMLFRIASDHMGIVPMWPYICGTVILCGALCTSRIILGRHTLWQVAAGSANGFIVVYLLTM